MSTITNNNDSNDNPTTSSSPLPSLKLTLTLALFYVLSGVMQPLIMTLIKEAGLSDPRAQLYMAFYYLGPACVTVLVERWPRPTSFCKTVAIALFDFAAQAMNYTGTTLAGPTIFAIIYSSVTIWTALFSFLFLKRPLYNEQWWGVFLVFGGLCITGLDSITLGPAVVKGSLMVLTGSIMHSLTYVMSEAIMVYEDVTTEANSAIQGIVGCSIFTLWQIIFTRRHVEEILYQPMENASTTWTYAGIILFAFAFSNFLHSFCFFHTLLHCPGGATSAGIMKGLQAVLVFIFTSIVYCGRVGGSEMCFSIYKFISLLVVVGGVLSFAKGTTEWEKNVNPSEKKNNRNDYESIPEVEE